MPCTAHGGPPWMRDPIEEKKTRDELDLVTRLLCARLRMLSPHQLTLEESGWLARHDRWDRERAAKGE